MKKPIILTIYLIYYKVNDDELIEYKEVIKMTIMHISNIKQITLNEYYEIKKESLK